MGSKRKQAGQSPALVPLFQNATAEDDVAVVEHCGLPLAGTYRPALSVCIAPLVGADDPVRPFCAPILFFLFLRKKRTAAASEEASSIPFPPGRRKLHIRWLLLPFQTVTVSLGHNLAIWNFTTPHAILMMAGGRHLANTEKPGLPYAASPEQGSGR